MSGEQKVGIEAAELLEHLKRIIGNESILDLINDYVQEAYKRGYNACLTGKGSYDE